MKIFVLRHERRGSDHSFDVSLNEEGLMRRHNLKNDSENIGITKVFSSPYKRTIQTVEPFPESKNMKINLEYSLYESLTDDLDGSNIRDIDQNIYCYNRVNHNYQSFLKKDELNYGELYDDIKDRTRNYLEWIKDNDELKNDNILLVTHMTTLNSILNRQPEQFYDGQKVSLIYNGEESVFETVN